MKRVVFMGTPDFSVPILQNLVDSMYEVVLVVTQPDRPKGRKKVITPPPVKVEAEKHQLPVFQPEKLREDYQTILDYEPDLIITAAYGQILPKELLDGPEYGCINVHASLLPELRGGAPIHYAIVEGKQETGITIMYMVEKLDAGDILTQQPVTIDYDDNVGTLHGKLAKVGSTLLLETLPLLFEEKIKAVKQDESQATFAANIRREQERIDWSEPNNEIYNHIRGMNPWPVAFTTYESENMKIWEAELDNNNYTGIPGEIIKKTEDGAFIVLCGNQKAIKVTEIQPAGNKRILVSEYLLGSEDRIKLGVIMGE